MSVIQAKLLYCELRAQQNRNILKGTAEASIVSQQLELIYRKSFVFFLEIAIPCRASATRIAALNQCCEKLWF